MSTHPRTRRSIHILLISLLLLASLPALPQNGNTRRNDTQAVLHIKVNLVRTVALPPVRNAPPVNNAVTYNFSTAKPDVDVIKEVRPLLGNAIGQSVNGEGAVLKTVTIVPH